MLKKTRKVILSIFICFTVLFASCGSQVVYAYSYLYETHKAISQTYAIYKRYANVRIIAKNENAGYISTQKLNTTLTFYENSTDTLNLESSGILLKVKRLENDKFCITATTSKNISLNYAQLTVGKDKATRFDRQNNKTIIIDNVDLKPSTNTKIKITIPYESYLFNTSKSITKKCTFSFFVNFLNVMDKNENAGCVIKENSDIIFCFKEKPTDTLKLESSDISLKVKSLENGKFSITATTSKNVSLNYAKLTVGKNKPIRFERQNNKTIIIENVDLKPNTNTKITVTIPYESYLLNTSKSITYTCTFPFYVNTASS